MADCSTRSNPSSTAARKHMTPTWRFFAYSLLSSLMRASARPDLSGSSFSSSVRSSGSLKVARISSGVLPSIMRASARDVRSTSGFISRLQ